MHRQTGPSYTKKNPFPFHVWVVGYDNYFKTELRNNEQREHTRTHQTTCLCYLLRFGATHPYFIPIYVTNGRERNYAIVT